MISTILHGHLTLRGKLQPTTILWTVSLVRYLLLGMRYWCRKHGFYTSYFDDPLEEEKKVSMFLMITVILRKSVLLRRNIRGIDTFVKANGKAR
jgi:hypothetical protein